MRTRASNTLSPAPEEERFACQLALPHIGRAGQQRLARATVLVVGMGGLGTPAALYLAASGVGHLRLIDGDRVERSNLARQFLYTESDLGTPKVLAAHRALTRMHPATSIDAMDAWLDDDTMDAVLAGVDLVVDGCDNLETRQRVSAACCQRHIAWIGGAINGLDGQLMTFRHDLSPREAPCYSCLFPVPPTTGHQEGTCSHTGVLVALAGTLGAMQAAEAVRALVGFGVQQPGQLVLIDLLSWSMRTLTVPRNLHCPACSPGRQL
jgi:molybdopterin/thiamine biosynthesis adenylyltransferase